MGSHRVGRNWMTSQCSPGLLSLFRNPKMLQRASFSSADRFIYCQYLHLQTYFALHQKSFGGLWKLSIRKILPSSTWLHLQVPNKITSLTFTYTRSGKVCDLEKGSGRVGAGVWSHWIPAKMEGVRWGGLFPLSPSLNSLVHSALLFQINKLLLRNHFGTWHKCLQWSHPPP